MKRKLKPPTDDYPAPWEDRPVSEERWRKHRDRMMAVCAVGRRPCEWWLYEMRRPVPQQQTLMLYEMGALRSDELVRLQRSWRMFYDEAYEVIPASASYAEIRKTPEQRREYLDRHQVPREVVAQWDAERAKLNDDDIVDR